MRVKSTQSACEFAGVEPSVPAPGSKLGIALSTLGRIPIHGMRVPPDRETNGWYIWCGGEPSQADDFYSPLHIEHIGKYLPSVTEYLNLPPGFRFLIDGENYEDVWFDARLLEI